MSRLNITITHENGGQLLFGVQSDNADEQVRLLQHQLANVNSEALQASVTETNRLDQIITNQRAEIQSLEAVIDTERAVHAEALKARRKRPAPKPAKKRRR